MCRKILAHGIKTLHLYTLNMEKSALGILMVVSYFFDYILACDVLTFDFVVVSFFLIANSNCTNTGRVLV